MVILQRSFSDKNINPITNTQRQECIGRKEEKEREEGSTDKKKKGKDEVKKDRE